MLSGREMMEKKTLSVIIHPRTETVKIRSPKPNFLVPTISILFKANQKRKINAVKEYNGEER
jgi:hypothetical protein